MKSIISNSNVKNFFKLEIRNISLLGAYYYPKMRQIVLAFDDEIGMYIPFQVTKKTSDNSSGYVEGMWRPAGGELKHDQLNIDRSYGFIWIFTFFDSVKDDFEELTVTVKPEFIVPSHSEVKLARTIQSHCVISDDGNLSNLKNGKRNYFIESNYTSLF